MEAECFAAFVHQLPTCGGSGCKPRRIGSGQLSADDLSSLPGTGDAAAGKNMVRHRTGDRGKSCPDASCSERAMNMKQAARNKIMTLHGCGGRGSTAFVRSAVSTL